MAYTMHIPTSFLASWLTTLSTALAKFSNAISGSAAMDQRLRRIEDLNAKSDAELAAMNLRRQDIPSHVFRDLMHI